MGLSRRVLDDALLRRAQEAGALLRSGRSVRRIGVEDGLWTAVDDGVRCG